MNMRTILSSRFGHFLLKLVLAALIAFSIAAVCLRVTAYAGVNADGMDGDYEYEPEPGQLMEAVTVTMKDGGVYDIGSYKKATWLVCSTSGTFTVKGQSSKTMMVINAAEGLDMTIIFDNVRLVATKDCPGALANARSAIEIKGDGGTVTLCSAPGSENYFRAKGGRPCIRKDTTGVKLIFSTVDENNPGTMEVHADPNAHCTCAIGCYGTLSVHNTFGNCVFQSGNIQAYGSAAKVGNSVWYGGAAIGADEYSAVDGITFENANVYAEAGSASAAGIGTTSCYLFNIISTYDRAPQPCSNITVNGGTIYATHKANSEDGSVYGGAGIGGGWGGSCDHITINGGTVTACGSSFAAGIGGGEDGDATDIVINGGTIHAQGGSAGIGGGEASGYVCDDDSLRYGDCRVTINGGEITAIGGKSFSGSSCCGVGIGGWKEKFHFMSNSVAGRMKITINGGNIVAQGNRAAAIGSGRYGNCQDITITGGVIRVHTSDSKVDIGGYGDAISTCENITITGGTISNTEAGTAVVIGGGNPAHWYDKADSRRTNVYISGGNVHGKVYGEDHARLSSQSDTPVYLYEICLADFGLGYRYDSHAVSGFTVSPGLSYTYGLKDTYLFPSSVTVDPVMYAWLPEGVDGSTLTTDPAFLDYTYDMRREDVNFFSGNITGKTGSILYPRLWFLFDDNYLDGDLTRDSASYYIGEKKTEKIHNETFGNTGAVYYSLDKEGKVPLLKPDGTYYPSVMDPVKGICWTDPEGKIIFEPGVTQNYYTNGIQLYAVWPAYDLEFVGNKPAGTSMKLSGSTTGIGDVDPTKGAVLPPCGFKLKNYVFTGWNTKADGSGNTYQPGETVTERIPESGRTVYLYAMWEPVKYSVVYDPGEGEGTRTSRKYAFDKNGVLADPAELGFGKVNCVFLGWTTGAAGNLYAAGDSFVNMCGLDAEQNILERTLTALWMPKESVAVTVTLNGEAVTFANPKNDLVLIQNGTRFTGFERESSAGAYVLKTDVRGTLPPGTYTLSIEGFDTGGVTLEIGEGTSVSLILDYCTVSVSASEHIMSSELYGTGGKLSGSVNVREGTELNVISLPETGYSFDRYEFTGTEPGWEHGPGTAAQKIRVNGQVSLSARAVPNTYTVVFNANGGAGSMPDQSAVYGEEFALYSAVFTRKGYAFDGWNTVFDGSGTAYEDEETVKNLTSEDGGRVTLYAMWSPVPYKVSYDLRGGKYRTGESNPSSYTIEDEFALVSPVRSGYTFLGWTGTDAQLPEKNLTVPKGSVGNRKYTANWERNSYSVTFEMGGHGAAPEGQMVDEGEIAEQPSDPAETGWIFGGWYTDETCETAFNFDTPIVKNTVIYAKWTEKEPVYYTVSFNMNGHGTAPDSRSVEEGKKAERPSDPAEAGWIFGGWYTDETCTTAFDFDTPIIKDTVIYAKWTEKEPVYYTISFNMNGHGTAPDSQSVEEGKKAERPSDPAETGWIFGGWYTDETCVTAFNFDTPIVKDTVIYAKWTEKEPVYYTVSFNMGGHGTAPDNQSVEEGKKAEKPADPAEVGWIFGGWYTDDTCLTAFDFDTPITKDTVIYAKWTKEAPPKPETYIVSFNMGGHGGQIAPQIVKDGEKAVRPDDPAEEKWKFLGWYADAAFAAVFDFDAPVHADLAVYAKWEAVPPKTGDSVDCLPRLLMLLCGGAVLCGAALYRRKETARRK